MNILSAIYSGQSGFLKASEAIAQKAERVSEFSSNPAAQESAAADLVGMKLDSVQAKASLGVVKLSSDLLHELVADTLKK